MPAYSYQCQLCKDITDEILPIGDAPRLIKCKHCHGLARLRIGVGVHIAPSALENKGEKVRSIDQTEAQWGVDMPAYKRMRNAGMQPKNIDGAAVLEDQVGSQADIDYKRLIDEGVTRERIQEGQEQAREIIEGAGIEWKGAP